MLRLPASMFDQIAAHALSAPPDSSGLATEICGFLVGTYDAAPDRSARRYVKLTNVAASARYYAVDPAEHLRTERAAERDGLEIIGVVHSHTHTDAYPSPTDVAQAPDPSWSYAIVSLAHGPASLRSYLIVDGNIQEELVVLD